MKHNSIQDRLSALNTDTVSEALYILNLGGATFGLLPLWRCPKIVGRVSTVEFGINPDTSVSSHSVSSFLDDLKTNDRIIVISGGISGVSCFENIINHARKSSCIRGAIIDGACQGNDDLRHAEYPVYGRGFASKHVEATQVGAGTPLKLRGLMVYQDDYVIADNSGTVFVSAAHIEKVLETAESTSYQKTRRIQSFPDGNLPSKTLIEPSFDAMPTLQKDMAMDQKLVALFAGLDTPAVSDALDKLGIPGQVMDIMPLTNYEQVVVGPAFTVRYVPATTSGSYKGVGDWIDNVAQGDVILIDNGGRKDCTIWGDIMTQYASIRGIAGTVIDGVCRDVNRAISDDYPMFTAGRWMRTSKDRMEIAGVNEPVGIGRVHVKPRDIVVADVNGVVIVPRDRAREVAGIARSIVEIEKRIREMIAEGSTLCRAREEFNYHRLQSREQ
ncbi:hypothetical protein ACHAPJ_013006 [Fusarium lateritium]